MKIDTLAGRSQPLPAVDTEHLPAGGGCQTALASAQRTPG